MIAFLVGLLVGVPAGLGIGYWLWHVEPTPATEAVRGPVRQGDGSLVVARVAMTNPGKPPHQLPKKDKEERRVHLVVTPNPSVTYSGEPCTCDPVEVNLSLVRGPDGTGIVASADGGRVEDESVDIPIASFQPPQYRHFALITAQPGAGNYTGIVGKRFIGNRLGVGIGANKVEGKTPGALVGVEFNW